MNLQEMRRKLHQFQGQSSASVNELLATFPSRWSRRLRKESVLEPSEVNSDPGSVASSAGGAEGDPSLQNTIAGRARNVRQAAVRQDAE